MNRKLLALPVLLGTLTPVLAGCGSSVGGGGAGKSIVVGTTDSIELTKDNPAPLDPATSYDSATWNVFYNTFQMLLTYERGSTDPSPDAAQACDYDGKDGLTYRCTLRPGLAFSNGDPLTSRDVKFSLDRMKKINWAAGPSSLVAGVKSVETPDDSTVVFHLKAPDATFPAKLATPAAAILDHAVYSADKPYKGFALVGSGPYTLDSWSEGKQAVFTRNKHYKGAIELNNDGITLKLFADSHTMENALHKGDIDVLARTLNPDQIGKLTNGMDSDVRVTESPGGEARYLFLNTAADDLKSVAVRRALAQLVDRDAITRDVYRRTATPLYSVIPAGIAAHANTFYQRYGEPSVPKAKALLRDAGFTGKVALTINFRRDSGGTVNEAEAEEIARQLNASGLFTATTKSEQWNTFLKKATQRAYEVFALSWLPDFPDPDNYIAPFFTKSNFLNLAYHDSTIEDTLLPRTRRQASRGATAADFLKAQNIVAADVPLLPLWQGKQYIIARNDITGVEWALNSSTTTQFWELGRVDG